MYNSINPINITYKNPRSYYGAQAYGANANQQQTPLNPDEKGRGQNQQFPNGTKVAIDYTKNTINISQIVTDFKSTIIAINAPQELSDEVNSYLALVEKEATKPNPSRDIILSNLKNASKISDKYINDELAQKKGQKEPKNVVEGWIDALFLQKIELKADPTHINPDFQLEIPDKKVASTPTGGAASIENQELVVNEQEKSLTQEGFQSEVQSFEVGQNVALQEPQTIQKTVNLNQNSSLQSNSFGEQSVYQAQNPYQTQNLSQIQNQQNLQNVEKTSSFVQPAQIQEEQQIEAVPVVETSEIVQSEPIKINATIATPKKVEQNEISQPQKPKSKFISSEHDKILSRSLKEAKILLNEADDPAGALELLNDTLGELREDTNENLRAALHFERGKIFDDYDYVNYALRDYYEATKCEDDNLKSQAHLKMARIYNEYVEFEPALEHYQDAVGFSGEANNSIAQTKILGEMAWVYASRYDEQNVQLMNELALDCAQNSGDFVLLSSAYSQAGKTYEHIGEDFSALDCYKNAVKSAKTLPQNAQSYEIFEQNYTSAGNIMQRLGNSSKAENLLLKARQYRQRAQLERQGAVI